MASVPPSSLEMGIKHRIFMFAAVGTGCASRTWRLTHSEILCSWKLLASLAGPLLPHSLPPQGHGLEPHRDYRVRSVPGMLAQDT